MSKYEKDQEGGISTYVQPISGDATGSPPNEKVMQGEDDFGE